MFSTTQLTLIEPVVQSMYVDGYEYYVVHTNTNLNNYSNYDYQDLTFYFSKKPIEYRDNNTYFGADMVKLDVITRNGSNNQSDSKLPRFTVQSIGSGSFGINQIEFVMSNCGGTYMDCMAMVEYDSRENISYNLDLNFMYVIPVLISILIISNWLRMWFARTDGKEK